MLNTQNCSDVHVHFPGIELSSSWICWNSCFEHYWISVFKSPEHLIAEQLKSYSYIFNPPGHTRFWISRCAWNWSRDKILPITFFEDKNRIRWIWHVRYSKVGWAGFTLKLKSPLAITLVIFEQMFPRNSVEKAGASAERRYIKYCLCFFHDPVFKWITN